LLPAVQVLTQAIKLKALLKKNFHCDAVMVKDVNEDLIKGYDIFTPIAATDLGFDPGIPVIEAGPILFRIPAMSAPVFDNIEAAIKEHGLS